MSYTLYHAKYFAHELTQRFASKVTAEGFDDADNLDKLTASLSDAQVDLNPHQVDAALFALRSPLSQGVILADEVGLGKTIEAGIVISQRWAERKRRILIICPANLRKQWSQELADKFFLPSLILEKKSFNEAYKKQDNPFKQDAHIVICSFQFARAKDGAVSRTNWDLVVIDEAHRLRNVYRKDNKIANALKDALSGKPKILLTATPLQNTLLELYGLVSLVDDYIFGDLRSFRQQYARITSEAQFAELKQRIAPVCKRTLREQVREYVRYTERLCITHGFTSADDEHELYMQVSEYLRKEKLYALPASQRALMTLILRKLLASSTFAIADTLKGLDQKLEAILARHETASIENEEEAWTQDFETAAEIQEEWNDDPDFDTVDDRAERYYTTNELDEIRQELEEVRGFYQLAKSIQQNSKGDNLVIALDKGFEKMRELGAAEKAVIFTESVRTQQYIRDILERSGYGGKIVLFNGSNNDPESTRIYQEWIAKNKGSDRVSGSRAADIRAALTECFRDEAQILIATEAAAEGINLQFCSLVVNYDMPWNPQRIEQRIGRCHRYGQRFNVVVINFLNERNAADVRVYQLLNEKFNLFNGVFGSSDDVLGTIESGVDFEKRIVQIYQSCRTELEIQTAFDALRHDLEESIALRLDQTHQQLLENFDEEVLEKIKVESEQRLDAFENKFWEFSRFALAPFADQFDDENHSFRLLKSPIETIPVGNFRFLSHRLPHDRLPKDAQVYRIGHPLAKHFLRQFENAALPCAEVVFDTSNTTRKVTIPDHLIGASGWMQLETLTLESLESEDFLLFAGMDDEGILLQPEQCRRMFSLSGQLVQDHLPAPDPDFQQALEVEISRQRRELELQRNQQDVHLFNREMDKLDQWANDRRMALHAELRALEQEIRLSRNTLRQISTLADRVKEQRRITDLEKKLADLRFQLHAAEDTIEADKNLFLDEVEKKLEVKPSQKTLFVLKWTIK
jgi:superfamily II DNA or RNA helicase